MVLEIPIVSNAAHFVQENEIAKKSFFFEFEWIEEAKLWLLHISDGQEKPLALGIRVFLHNAPKRYIPKVQRRNTRNWFVNFIDYITLGQNFMDG